MSCRGSAAGCGRLAMASTAFPRAGAGADGSRHVPKYPTKDPNYRILARQRSRFTHYYLYIRDETLGPMVMRVASSLPFQATVEHRAAAAMQGVTLELAKRDNALALQPVQFDRHSERNSGRLCRSSHHHSPRRRRATEAVLRTAGILPCSHHPPSTSSSRPRRQIRRRIQPRHSLTVAPDCRARAISRRASTSQSHPNSIAALRRFPLPLPMPHNRREAEVGSPSKAVFSAPKES